MIKYLRKLLTGAQIKREFECAKANYEAAVRRGDTRAQSHTFQALCRANNQRLKVGL